MDGFMDKINLLYLSAAFFYQLAYLLAALLHQLAYLPAALLHQLAYLPTALFYELAYTKMEEMFRRADDFVHRENVKVYRNVQAATTEELEKQTQAVISGQQELERKNKKLYTIGILTLITSIANLPLFLLYPLLPLPPHAILQCILP